MVQIVSVSISGEVENALYQRKIIGTAAVRGFIYSSIREKLGLTVSILSRPQPKQLSRAALLDNLSQQLEIVDGLPAGPEKDAEVRRIAKDIEKFKAHE